MSLLVESIKLLDGRFYNLFHHEQRMVRSLSMLCGVHEEINLETFLQNLDFPGNGLYKCRITYDDKSKDVQFVPYIPREISSLRIVEHDRINYEFKYADRSAIDRLFKLRNQCDDILIVKRGLVTDASAANIAFRKKNRWYTPWSALLKGTQRQKLIGENILIEEEIKPGDIRSFDTFKLLNAMTEFDGPEIEVEKIV